MNNNEYPEQIEAYVRTESDEPDGPYCPIEPRWGYLYEDGFFVDEEKFLPGDYFVNPGFLIILLGGINYDHPLEKAAEAVFASIHSLFAACGVPVHFERMRTFAELQKSIEHNRESYSHVILIGHGSKHGISFIDRNELASGSELASAFECFEGCDPIQVISLCCHSGCEALSSQLSKAEMVSEVIAPKDTFHIQWAVHFITGYLLEFFVNSQSVAEAVRKSAVYSSKTPMCVWKDGVLYESCIV